MKETTYAFILGRNPALSISEIHAFLVRSQIAHTIVSASEEVLVLSIQNVISMQEVMSALGGVIKIVEILKVLDVVDSETEFLSILSGNFLNEKFFPSITRKIHFGVSLYYLDKEIPYIPSWKKFLMYVAKHVKKELQAIKKSSGFVQMKERFLSSVSVQKNTLLRSGAEIVCIASSTHLYIGRTIQVQLFESYSFRDFGRPARDVRSGILPPKLAQALINLSSKDYESVLLDPFCGSGTIITEALLMGYKHIYGSDISQKAITDTTENVRWLKDRYVALSASPIVKNIDVLQLSKYFPQNSVDCIATEPYLGPAVNRFPTRPQIDRVIRELSTLYLGAFGEYAKILKKGGRVVMIFPAFRWESTFLFMDILSKIEMLGFKQVQLLTADLKEKFSEFISKRGNVLYGRGDEFVFREILIFDYK